MPPTKKMSKKIPITKHISDDENSDNDSSNSSSSSSSGDNNKKTIKKSTNAIQSDQIKKRGRPKKTEEKSKPVAKSVTKIGKVQDVILHLPLHSDSDEDSDDDNDTKKNVFTMNDDTDTQYGKRKITTIMSLSDNSDCVESDSFDEVNVQKLLLELKKKDALIKKLQMQNSHENENDIKSYGNNTSAYVDSKVENVDLKLINIKNGTSQIIEKTDIVCWWDTCQFSGMPCFMPDKYNNGTYYVFGCFCSFNCMLAYNSTMNDYRSSIRLTLIKHMYRQIYGHIMPDNIVHSSKREVLEKFGGTISLADYRDKSINVTKEFKMKIPPIIPLIASIEEISCDNAIIVPARVHQYKGRNIKTKIAPPPEINIDID